MLTKFSRGRLDAFRCIELLRACGWLALIWLATLGLPSTRCTAQNEPEGSAPAVAAAIPPASASAEQPNTNEPTSAGLIDFNRDVRPIFEGTCLECHGPKSAKEGFRVDEKETLLAYVEPGDLESSSLWSDYLVTTDEDMKMPPTEHNKPLTGAQLATIKLWIEEGAKWADAPVAAATAVIAPIVVKTKFQRVTKFLGLFHPAAVHFPVALILISTFFLMCSFVFRDAFEGAAFHCLWIGAVSACASSALGWFFAESQGYGASPSFDLSSALERHRWTAVLLSGLSIAMIPVALAARREPDNRGRRIVWLLGAGLLSVLVSIAGHQGGEMVFGEDLYTPAFKAIFEVPQE